MNWRTGVSIVLNALRTAYRRTKGGEAAVKATEKAEESMGRAVNDPTLSRRMMRLDEALKVLNIDPSSSSSLSKKNINDRFEKLFLLNDVAKGGSLYLQAKIYRARESIDIHLQQGPLPQTAPAEKAAPTDGTAGKK